MQNQYKVIQDFSGIQIDVHKGDVLDVKEYTDKNGIYLALWKDDKLVCDIESKFRQIYCQAIFKEFNEKMERVFKIIEDDFYFKVDKEEIAKKLKTDYIEFVTFFETNDFRIQYCKNSDKLYLFTKSGRGIEIENRFVTLMLKLKSIVDEYNRNE